MITKNNIYFYWFFYLNDFLANNGLLLFDWKILVTFLNNFEFNNNKKTHNFRILKNSLINNKKNFSASIASRAFHRVCSHQNTQSLKQSPPSDLVDPQLDPGWPSINIWRPGWPSSTPIRTRGRSGGAASRLHRSCIYVQLSLKTH